MTQSTAFFVGLDVHKDWISAAVLEATSDAPPLVTTLPADERKLRRLLREVQRRGQVRACYEASGGGYTLQRQLASWGVPCDVIAPSLIPKRPGDRCKTDERDAKELALLHRAGLLTPVHVPEVEQEQARDLARCRDAVRRQQHRSRQHVLKFLRTRGLVFREGKHWTQMHWRWLRALELPAHARRAQTRLCGRFRKLSERMHRNLAAVAIARELVGFVWALMHDDPSKWLATKPR